MKNTAATLAFTALLIGASPSANAQSAPDKNPGRPDSPEKNRSERGGGRGGEKRPDPLFLALDADKDGSLSPAELKNAAAALRTLDKNNDGKLTRDELGEDRRSGGKGKGNVDRRGKRKSDKQRRDNPNKSNR